MKPLVVVMGVAGCGKTEVGIRLSEALGVPFYDGDDYHPPENVAKMSAGNPLNDDDRVGWLTGRVHASERQRRARPKSAVAYFHRLR